MCANFGRQTATVDSAPFSNSPQSTYKSGKAVQTNGATSAFDIDHVNRWLAQLEL